MTHSTPDNQSSSQTEPDQESTSALEPTAQRRLRRKPVIAVAVLALAAAGFGSWALTAGPLSTESYCWGAWEEGSGSPILGDAALKDDGSRKATETSPSADSPHGECTLTVKSASSQGSQKISYEDRVTVRYGTAPRDTADRRAWMGEFLYAGGERLPDGLPGLVDTDRGLLVLPKECDQDGQPTVVTLRAHGTSSSAGDSVANPTSLGVERDVANLLLHAANQGMEKAGCAPDQKLRLTEAFPATEANSPKARSEERSPAPSGVCDIPGLRSGDNWIQTGRDERLEICSVTTEVPQQEPEFAGQFLAVTEPRIVDLFNSMAGNRTPGSGWKGKGVIEDSYAVVKAQCNGAATVFFQQLSEDMQKVSKPGPKQVFANRVNAATERAQCDRITPAN
ncbi:hypothetical protein ACFQVC_03160 [Streptomyces monticola]|uniref:DUF3558 domain-containing protein n=1 Tax=Streptomyces monticola TaxID=2666263 RepID=A0ABW2JCW1_9ACTN